MGDYVNRTGEKIGTCGQAYYATLEMLKKENKRCPHDSEVSHYLKPENKCSFAFPFPEYDNKEIGAISNFHEGQRVFFPLYLSGFETFHGKITHHIHPRNAEGVNLFTDCPYRNENVSRNMNKSIEVFHLTTQVYYEGKLHIMGECAYCGERNVFSMEEAQIIASEILERSDKLIKYWDNYPPEQKEQNKKQSEYLREVSKRIIETYNN